MHDTSNIALDKVSETFAQQHNLRAGCFGATPPAPLFTHIVKRARALSYKVKHYVQCSSRIAHHSPLQGKASRSDVAHASRITHAIYLCQQGRHRCIELAIAAAGRLADRQRYVYV